ncbi:hypothetical protein GE09DRAFT_1046515 [Coniochaeta sp. 2T2.1]|nr:hypothetical protein GE09DRAFT_1046515 [Coniochaeta sp. 2T2.1]
MSLTRFIVPILAFLAALADSQLRLNVTAIGAANGVSTLECWEVDSPFHTSSDSATREPQSRSSAILPAAGRPFANYCRWVVLLKGFGQITLPHDNTTGAYITGGEFGVIFAADTSDVSCDGHISTNIGSTEFVSLMISTQDGTVPEHEILHTGPCVAEEMAGWRMG